MRMSHCISIACVAAGILAVVGCNREKERTTTTTGGEQPRVEERPQVREHEQPGTTTITGAKLANVAAVDKVVAARCEREATCKNVGVDKRYANAQVCSQKLHADMKEDLNAKECPHGIDQKELNECLEAIRKEDCNNPIDTIGRLAACRTSDLCLATSPTNR